MSIFSDWQDRRSAARVKRFVSDLKRSHNIVAGDGKTGSRTDLPYSDSGSKYAGGTDDYNVVLQLTPQELRRKSRSAVFDSPPLASIRERKTQSVVDTGIMVDPAPDIESIGLSERDAAAFMKYARGYNDWMACKFQHRREQMTFFQAQGLAQSEKIRDGEYFFRLYYNYDDKYLPHPLQWEALDADQVPDAGNLFSENGFATTDTNSSKNPNDGIRTDERGRATEYNIQTQTPDGTKSNWIPAKTPDGKYQIIHGFSPEYSFQKRGFPSLSKILQDSKELQDFSMANIKKAINQSQKVFAVENQDQDPSSPFDEKSFTDAMNQYFAQNPDGTATPTVAAIQYLNSPLFKNISLQTQPGAESLIMAEKGSTIKAIDNTAPVQQYDIFVGAFFSFLAAAENVPVEVVLMKFGSNYSASRAALILFFRICEIERADLDADLISPTYEMYLDVGIAQGFVTAPGWSDPRIRQWYIRHRTIGAPLPSINPKDESEAALNQIAIGGSSFTRNAHTLNGSDVDKNIAANLEKIDDIKRIREGLGLIKTGQASQ